MKIALFPGSFKPPHIGHYTLVKKMLPKVDQLYIIISPKPRNNITAQQSKKIWETYLKGATIIIADESPIMYAYRMALKKLKSGEWTQKDILYLIKSSKNAANQRFQLFHRLNLKLVEKTMPKFKTISSINMRKTIDDRDYTSFKKFLPKHLTSNQQKEIYGLVKITDRQKV